MFNGLRYVVKTGAPWRWIPDDLPPWDAVYQRAQSWLAAGRFEQRADDLPQANRDFVLLPWRWVVERSFARATRVRRLVKYYERYPSTLADLHIVAFVCLILKLAAQRAASS